VVLSSALPPILAKVVAKIRSGQYVPMKDLLADNMSLCVQLERLPGPHHVYAEAQTARYLVPTDMDVVFPGLCYCANA
jgi:hypothetical protein